MKNSERIENIKRKVLNNVLTKKIDIQLDAWLDYLETELSFPFKASIQESENFELKWNDIVNVKQIENFIDMYGLLLEIRKGRRKYIFPLCQLEVVEKQSKNRFIIDAFLEWWDEEYL
ncbi:MAG: calcium-binding protein [Candidatus Cloacimonadota bacterium]|nr:calcium-binding protein [Candidatus Cloacimonadota bacterium]